MNLSPLTLARPGSGSQAEVQPGQANVSTEEFGALFDQIQAGTKAEDDGKEATPSGPNAPAPTLDLIAALLPGPMVNPAPTTSVAPVQTAVATPSVTAASQAAIVSVPTIAEPMASDSMGVEEPKVAGAKKMSEPEITDLRQIGEKKGTEVKQLLSELGAQKVVVEDDAPVQAPVHPVAGPSQKQEVRLPEAKKPSKFEFLKESEPKEKVVAEKGSLSDDTTQDGNSQDAPESPKAPATAPTDHARPIESVEPKKDDRPKPVVDQVSDAMHDIARARRPGKVTIILEPAHLGSVTVTVKHSGNRFTADIQATDPVVSQQLADNKQDLVRAAESHGLSMDSFNVSHQDAGQSAQQQQTREEFQRTFRLNQTDRIPDLEIPAVTYVSASTRGFETLA